MNRSNLITRLAGLHPQLLANDAESVVKVILDVLSNMLSNGGRNHTENHYIICLS
jgi:nucleoid DNA-binding protein